jgi:hypothetical protein
VPLPAAGINAKMAKEVVLIQNDIITRFFPRCIATQFPHDDA